MPFLRPTYIIAILIAIAVHECAHAFMADRLGDRTARHAGRLTLNPVSHIDPLGALMFVVIGFGWAKPVPVDPRNFRHPTRDMSLTALAGPVSNLILGLIAFIGLTLIQHTNDVSVTSLLSGTGGGSAGIQVLGQILADSLFVNLALMAFNLFPVAPLDGSNIIRIFIPARWDYTYDEFVRIGPWVLLGLILFESFLPIPLLSGWVHGIMSVVLMGFEMIV